MELPHEGKAWSQRTLKASPRGAKLSSPSLLSTRVSLRSCKSSPRLQNTTDSLVSQPLKSVFPDWLESRKDFLEVRNRYERLDAIDVFRACQKPVLLRSDLDRKAVVKTIKACPFFSSMKDEQLLQVTECLKSVLFRDGEKLMEKGEAANCLFLILSGRVGIYIDSSKCVDEVLQGNVVGESAIQTHSPRSATVLAHTEVRALLLTYEDFDQVLYRVKLQDYYEVADFLRKVDYFADWNLSKLYRLASVIMVKQYPKGQKIFRRNDPAHDIYIVRDGAVRLTLDLDIQQSNRWPVSPRKWAVLTATKVYEKTLKVCTAGDFFGVEELIDGVPLRTTAVCESEIVLLFIVRQEFFHEIFSDKDRKALSETIFRRPGTQNLRYRLETEKRHIKYTADAMLDAISANAVPMGRDLFTSPGSRKRQQWARVLDSKRRREEHKGLILSTLHITEETK